MVPDDDAAETLVEGQHHDRHVLQHLAQALRAALRGCPARLGGLQFGDTLPQGCKLGKQIGSGFFVVVVHPGFAPAPPAGRQNPNG